MSLELLDFEKYYLFFNFYSRSHDNMGTMYVTGIDKSCDIDIMGLYHDVMAFMQYLRKIFFQMIESKKWLLDVYLYFTKCHFSCFMKKRIYLLVVESLSYDIMGYIAKEF